MNSCLITCCKLPPTLARQIWRHNYVIGRNEYLISTLSETTFPWVYSQQFLFKSTQHSFRFERKREWVFFSTQCTTDAVCTTVTTTMMRRATTVRVTTKTSVPTTWLGAATAMESRLVTVARRTDGMRISATTSPSICHDLLPIVLTDWKLDRIASI